MDLESAPTFTGRSLRRIGPEHEDDSEFSIVTYNILADFWLKKDVLRGRYQYIGDETNWRKQGKHSYRHKLLMSELEYLDSTILCLQEIEIEYYKDVLKDDLAAMGYGGVFKAKRDIPEGLGIFFKHSQFELKHQKAFYFEDLLEEAWRESTNLAPPPLGRPELISLAVLRHKKSGKLLAIGNVHVGYIWSKPVTQALQVACATQALKKFAVSVGSGDALPSHVLCGDFNIEPHFPAYQMLCSGHLSDEEKGRLRGYDFITWPDGGKAPSEFPPEELCLLEQLTKSFINPLDTLKSAYNDVMGEEPKLTSHDGPGNECTLDYIWFSSDTLTATAALETVPETAITPYIGLPNKAFPSDHLSVKAHFQFKDCQTALRDA